MKNFNPDAFLSDVSSTYWELIVSKTDDLYPDAFLSDVSSTSYWELIVSKTDDLYYSVCERANPFSLKIEEYILSSRIRVSEKFSSWNG